MAEPAREQTPTDLLARVAAGDRAAAEDLLPMIWGELHRIAERHLRRERAGHSLPPSELVDQAYLTLIDQKGADWQSRSHFFRMASQVIRRILVDHARHRNRQKRGGGHTRVPLPEDLPVRSDGQLDILALDEALERLRLLDDDLSTIVVLRFFGGLAEREAAEALSISRRTASERWRLARAWLRRELSDASA